MSMKMTMEEFVGLESCPFCGGEALLLGDYAHGYIVECHDCSARTANYGSENKKEVVAAWNTRVERTCRVKASYDTADVDNRGSNAEWYFMFTCGHELYWDDSEPPNYCSNCGAKVVGE